MTTPTNPVTPKKPLEPKRAGKPHQKTAETPAKLAADRQDERLARNEGLGGAIQSFRVRVAGGDLGSLPVVIGLIVIWAIFQIMNQNFLSANNLVNLSLQCAATGTIAIGVVLVLLVAQIDLSVGSISGLSAAILGVGITVGGWPIWLAIVVALAAGLLIGLIYAVLFTRFGVPTFVITLAGLLAFLGLQLRVLGPNGSINLPYESWIVQFAQRWFLPPWLAILLAVVAAGAMFGSDWLRARRRRSAGLSTGLVSLMVIKSAALLVVLIVAVAYLATDRGIGLMFLLFVLLVVTMNFFYGPHPMGALGLRRRRQRRSRTARRHQGQSRLHFGAHARHVFRGTGRSACLGTADFREFVEWRRRHEPCRHCGGSHRRNELVWRTRKRLFGVAGNPGDPVNFQRADPAELGFVNPLHDHRGGAAARSHHRFAVAPIACEPRPGLAGTRRA